MPVELWIGLIDRVGVDDGSISVFVLKELFCDFSTDFPVHDLPWSWIDDSA